MLVEREEVMEPEIPKPRKTKMIMVRATLEEARIMKENADKRGMKLSRYIRSRCVFDKI